MKTRILSSLLLALSIKAHAFTLLYDKPPRYRGAVEVLILGQDCNNISPTDIGGVLTAEKLREDVVAAVDRFWNRVHTSRLRFVVRPEVLGGPANLTTSEMLALAPENKILVGCSSNTTVFTSASILAGTRMSNTEPPRASVTINNTDGSLYATLTQEQRISTMAHEIGHALGLGHTTHKDALMYYLASDDVKVRYLSPDDADGSSYLYPKKSKFMGLVAGCGLVKDVGGPGSSGSHEVWGLLAEILLLGGLYLLWRKISFKRLARLIKSE
jgi:hypothetical protein